MVRFNDELALNIANVRGNICDIFTKERVVGSFVCGSVVSLEMPTSDIDIFVCCQDEISEDQRHDWTVDQFVALWTHQNCRNGPNYVITKSL